MPSRVYTRRRLLKAMGSSSLLAALTAYTDLPAAAQTRPSTQGDGPTVLVIGAGASGLAAARTLADAGVNVVVLEGRDRIGGRVWTNRSWPDMPLDMGASWIHGVEGNPLTVWADRLKLDRAATDYDNATAYEPNGRELSDADWDAVETTFEEILAEVTQAVEEADGDTTPLALGKLLEEAAAEWDLSPRQAQRFTYMVNTTIEHEFAADVANLSAEWWDNAEEFGGGDVVFPNGYGELMDGLAEGLDIRLAQVVERIALGTEGVTVTTTAGATFAADAAVVTLPLGVLQAGTVTFSPPLPKAKQQAIARLGSGVLNKTYLRFPTVFWDADVELLGFVSEEKGHWCEFLNLAAYTGAPVLLGFNAGAYGAALEDLADAEIVAAAMATLRQMYGPAIPDPEAYQITRWIADPFARGSYSYFKAGSTPEDVRALAAPVADRIFFAGEATHTEFPATVHGAYLSGEAAARAILRRRGNLHLPKLGVVGNAAKD